MQAQRTNFTQGPILSPLIRFTVPVLAALVLQTMYGAVDLLVIGRFCTAADVSAVSTGSQVMHMLTVVVTGLSMGTTVLLGQKLGQGDTEAAGRAAGTAVGLFGALGLILTAITVPCAAWLARVMQAPAEALDATAAYVRICGAGSLCIVAYNVLGSVFRGVGDARTPLVAVAIACAANIGLDLLFTAVFGMGVAGVALATVLAQLLSVALSAWLIRRRGLPFPCGRRQLRPDRALTARTLRLGAPVALQDFLVSCSFLVIIAIVNTLGVTASAGVGVAEKLCGFIMLLPSAFMQSMSAFVAQNIGAGARTRAKRAMAYGMAASFTVSLLLAWLGFFEGEWLASLFSRDVLVNAAAADYLRAYAIDTLLVSFLFCFIGYFNGCGQTGFVMAQGVAGAFGVRIPVSYLMSRLPGASLFWIGLATPCSTVVQIVLCALWFWRTERREAQADGARPARRRDVRGALALYRACARTGTSCWDDAYPNAEIAKEDLARGDLYVYTAQGRMAGVFTLMAHDDIEDMPLGFACTQNPCVLSRLCLSPARQGRGEGRLLLAAAEDTARARGHGAVHLLCDVRNTVGRGLYQSTGYRYVCRVPLYGHEYEVYEKAL